MFIYDELIQEINNINSSYSLKKLNIDSKSVFKENTNQLIFKDDKAFELGSGLFKGINVNLVSEDSLEDEILLIGDDLDSIKKDGNYARITIASVDSSLIGKGNVLYNNIRKFDYVKYHFALDKVMLRESTFSKKESLLVSKDALKKDKLNFSKIGSYLLNKYKELPFVKNVKIIFISLDDYSYDRLNEIVTKSENITKALDHLMNKVNMDCHSCSLQVICNEVEKKAKEDFKVED
jgi:hypothetical protein